MGSRAHRLPVFHLVGMPIERIQRLGLLTHHNLGDTVAKVSVDSVFAPQELRPTSLSPERLAA